MTETAVETYDTTTRGAASMAAYRAVRILQLLRAVSYTHLTLPTT